MKFLIAALALVAAASALPHERDAVILRQAQDISPEGSYNYQYETDNGIRANAEGTLQQGGADDEVAVVSQGSFEYTAPDGTPVQISYTADHNGYQPSGNVLPVAPAIPEQIQRALDYIAAHPPQPENRK